MPEKNSNPLQKSSVAAPLLLVQQGAGATITPNYLGTSEDVVGVRVNDLREFKTSAMEEAGQFAFAEFFFAGSIWLGLERAFTVEDFWTDGLFIACVFSAILGSVVGYFGLKQLFRRKTKIEGIIKNAEAMQRRIEEQDWNVSNSGTKK